MRISGFQKSSFQDWPGHLSSVIYFSGCNFRCPACHAKHVIEGNCEYDDKGVLGNLGLVKKVVLTGGEPTLQSDLPDFMSKLKEKGLAVKLDTNGSNPDFVAELIKRELVDYIAMDVKGPKKLYYLLTGKAEKHKIEDAEKTMQILSGSNLDYEFRTTIVPIERNLAQSCRLRSKFPYRINWMTEQEAEDMVKWVVDLTENNQHKYFLQPFVARGEDEILNYRLAKENLQKDMHRTPEQVLEEVCKSIKKHVPKCRIRGK